MPERFHVVIADFIHDDLAPEREALGDIADVVALDAYSEDDLAGRIDDADAVMLYHNVSISERTIDRLTRCRLIVRCGVGVDNVARDHARQRGIDVANVPDYGTEEVADSALGMTLALTRGVHRLNSQLRDPATRPEQWMYTEAAPLRRLRGRTFGVVGLGRIGTATALRAKACGFDVVFYDPYKPDGYCKSLGVRRVRTLDELLAQSFVLSLHCPLTDETRHMIDAAALARMSDASYLVNTSRGAVVDTAAIPAVIASGKLAGAAIDVLAHEPPPDDDPLIHAWRDPRHPAHHRLIVNPHSAFYCEEGLMEMRVKGTAAVRAALTGGEVRNVVN